MANPKSSKRKQREEQINASIKRQKKEIVEKYATQLIELQGKKTSIKEHYHGKFMEIFKPAQATQPTRRARVPRRGQKSAALYYLFCFVTLKGSPLWPGAHRH